MVDRVLSELADARDGITLVIDDLHELTSPDALAQLTRLLVNLPPNVHAILATRRDLPLRLHQLRLAGELAEIRAVDLRFTERETRELLQASGIALSEAGAAVLHQRTEGWAAGLRLAALSLAGHPDPERFVAEFSGSDRTVAEYLIAEMLERQPDDVKDLLLRTSLLDRVNGELADLLTGRPGSEPILLELEDANAFVVSLDPERTWFRYHHLFGDLLRMELRRALPAEVPALHRRAAGWFTRHGQVSDAIRHTQAAVEWPEAARLLADHSFSLTLDGQAQTVEALLRAFPRGAPADNPELALVRAGRNLARGRVDEAAAHLAVAESYAGTTPPDRQRRLRVGIASLKLALATRRGHLAGVIEQAELLASPVTGQSDQDIALDSDLRALALMHRGIIEAWSLGLPDAERHLQEGAALARQIGRPYVEVACLAQLGFASKIRSFATARRRCQEAIALAERHGWSAEWMIAPALVTLATNLTWTGEFGEARACLAALDHDRAGTGEIGNARAAISLADGDPAAALAAVQDVLDDTAPVIGYVTIVEAHLLAGLAYRQLGDQRAANQAAERALHLAEPDRLVLPFAMTGSAELLEALPRHETAHVALLTDILDVLHGSSLTARDQSSPQMEKLSPSELRVLRYLPTNLSRPEIASELSVSLNTIDSHVRNIYAKLQARDRSSAVQRARELRLLSARPTR